MVKYWNAARIRRIRRREERATERAAQRAREREEFRRTYTPGDARKNMRLLLDALGVSIHRKMVAWLIRGGAMSLSKLAEPFKITLPAALKHLRTLERAGLVTTHKRGRIRMCVFNPRATEELARLLASRDILRNLD